MLTNTGQSVRTTIARPYENPMEVGVEKIARAESKATKANHLHEATGRRLIANAHFTSFWDMIYDRAERTVGYLKPAVEMEVEI